MVHIAEPEFYSKVSERLRECDIILYEGVSGLQSRTLISSYSSITRNSKLGLVSQKEMNLEHVQDKLVHADIGGDEFDENWYQLPICQRWEIKLFAPVVGLYLRFFVTRGMIAKHLKLDDLETREELLNDSFDEVDTLLLDTRDEILTQAIDDCIEFHQPGVSRVGILYGATHMRAVIHHLTTEHGYRPDGGEWIDVFEL